MPTAAIDHEKQEALNMARMQSLNKGGFGMPQEGAADSYDKERLKDNFHVPSRGQTDKYSNQKKDDNIGNHAERLDKARQGSANNNAAEKARSLVQDAAKLGTPMGAISLVKQINFLGDIPYAAAMGAAILKDISDLVLVGSLPGLGTVITIMCSIFIFMMMLLVGAGEKKKMFKGMFKRGGAIIAGALVGFMPGLNFLPEETITVIAVYVLTLSERAHAPVQVERMDETEEDDE